MFIFWNLYISLLLVLNDCMGNWGLGEVSLGSKDNVELIVIMLIKGDLVSCLFLGRGVFMIFLLLNNLVFFFIDFGGSFFGIVNLYGWLSLISEIVNGLLGESKGIFFFE